MADCAIFTRDQVSCPPLLTGRRGAKVSGLIMKERHQIMEDSRFWDLLEYEFCRWFKSAENKTLRRFWCDGFLPEGITDTKSGVNVEGTAWVGQGREPHAWHFVVSVPQRMLYRKQRSFAIAGMQLNEMERTLWMEVTGLPQATGGSIN